MVLRLAQEKGEELAARFGSGTASCFTSLLEFCHLKTLELVTSPPIISPAAGRVVPGPSRHGAKIQSRQSKHAPRGLAALQQEVCC